MVFSQEYISRNRVDELCTCTYTNSLQVALKNNPPIYISEVGRDSVFQAISCMLKILILFSCILCQNHLQLYVSLLILSMMLFG